MIKMLIALICIATSFFSCVSGKNTRGSGHSVQIASYIRTWELPMSARSEGSSAYWNADMITGAPYLSDLIISFALIDQRDGTSLYIPGVTTSTADPFANLWIEVIRLKESHPHLRVSFSVGGWEAEGLHSLLLHTLQKKLPS